MKKILPLIIGITAISGLLAGQVAYAEFDCEYTLYDKVFKCGREQVYSYCSPENDADDAPDDIREREAPLGIDLYKSAYCEIARDSDEEIYEILAAQFAVENPKYDDEDIIEAILTELKLPEFEPKGAHNQEKVYKRVKAAYDREKIMYQSKESLKQQFKNRERWANADLDDGAPFDLIIDLNLIEIVMFGSLATWTDDVWSFPSDDSEDDIDIALLGGGEDDGGDSDDGGAAGPSDEDQTAEGSGEPSDDDQDDAAEAQPEIDPCECIPNDELEDLFGADIEEEEDEAEGPPPGVIPIGCGDGSKIGEEECDDGNNQAGDGCSESCYLESGNSLTCQDPQAVTFQQFSPSDTTSADDGGDGEGEGGGGGDEGGTECSSECPSGSTSRSEAAVIFGVDESLIIPQAPNYPGPFVGGVPKNFPPSKKPACPPGQSEYKLREYSEGEEGSAEGTLSADDADTLGIRIAGKEFEIPRCVPTNFCLTGSAEDFEEARKLLFGEDYKDDTEKSEAAAAIEAIICVDVKKVMRPESPYPLHEGCIDCHILAMVDIMDKMLEKNVAPLENNMSAWGLSNRWSPNVAFNISSSIKTIPSYPESKYEEFTEQDMTEAYVGQLLQDTSHKLDPRSKEEKTKSKPGTPASEFISDTLELKEKSQEGYYEGLKNYRAFGQGDTVSKPTHSDIGPMLVKILNSFGRLQEKYAGIALSASFIEKETCEF